MPRLTIDKQNRLIFYKNPIGYIRPEEQMTPCSKVRSWKQSFSG